jgi:hypothetical protein
MQATTVTMIALGVVLLLSPVLGEKIFYFVYYQSFDPPVAFPDEARRYIRFTNAVLGAVIIGWMFLSHRLISHLAGAPVRFFPALMLSFGSWFVVDTTFSALHGIWGNVGLNSLVALGLGLPGWLAVRKGEPGSGH